MSRVEIYPGVEKLQPGEVIQGKYRLEKLLGTGGFGVVWKARQLAVDRDVAIKFLATDDVQAAQRFEREAHVLGQLEHRNLVRIYDFEPGPPPFLVTEFAPGVTVRDWAATKPSEREIAHVMAEVAEAIAAGHAAGVIHRDIKPPNILVAADGAGLSVKVLDYGLAKVLAPTQGDITKTGEVWGTPGYMSPEQLRGSRDITPATDAYCLGVVLYELLSGEPPFVAQTKLEISMKHLADPPPDARTSSPVLRDLVRRLLDKDPAARPTLAEVCQTLRAAEAESWRPRKTLYLLAGLVAAVGLGAAWLATRPDDTPVEPQPAVISTPAIVAKPVATPDEPVVAEPVSGPCRGYPKLAPGRHVVERMYGLERESILTHLPKDYDPRRQYPVVLVFHDGLQLPEDALRVLDPMKNRFSEFVVVFAEDRNMMNQWKPQQAIPDALNQMDEAATEICMDTDRLFALGMGAGGLGAERMLCEHPDVVAVAMTSHRQNQSDPKCEPEHPKPLLFISVTDDPIEPIDGGTDCAGGTKWPLDKHVNWLKSSYGCKGRPTVTKTDIARCETWTCDAPLETCLIDGGRPWPGDPRVTDRLALEYVFACRSAPASYDYGTKIGDFFAAIAFE